MIKSLFRRRTPLRSRRIPHGLRVYAIGDVHGRSDLLDDMLARIEDDRRRNTMERSAVILLGDLVDRGPDSAGAVSRAMTLERSSTETHFIRGNHEELLLSARDGDVDAARIFARAGGRETLLSYGVSAEVYESADFADIATLLQDHVPADHAAFLERMIDFVEIGDYLFVHAGIMPGIPIAQQRPQHLRWIRREFLEYAEPHPAFVVHGHTITAHIDERENRLGIDTGAYASGVLTAVVLEGDQRRFIQTAPER